MLKQKKEGQKEDSPKEQNQPINENDGIF